MKYTEKSESGLRRGMTRSSDGVDRHFEITHEVSEFEGDEKRKRVVLQRLRYDDNRIQIRFGYYNYGLKAETKGKWVWARSTPIMDYSLFSSLLAKARTNNWPEFQSAA